MMTKERGRKAKANKACGREAKEKGTAVARVWGIREYVGIAARCILRQQWVGGVWPGPPVASKSKWQPVVEVDGD